MKHLTYLIMSLIGTTVLASNLNVCEYIADGDNAVLNVCLSHNESTPKRIMTCGQLAGGDIAVLNVCLSHNESTPKRIMTCGQLAGGDIAVLNECLSHNENANERMMSIENQTTDYVVTQTVGDHKIPDYPSIPDYLNSRMEKELYCPPAPKSPGCSKNVCYPFLPFKPCYYRYIQR